MKVLHISARVIKQSAPYRIHSGLLSIGINSRILVTQPSIVEDFVIYRKSFGKFFVEKMDTKMEGILLNSLSKKSHLPFSTGLFSNFDYKIVEDFAPDIINLHWICGNCLNFYDIKKLAKRYKVVWTLHDSWAFTGGCHIPYECRKYETECKNCNQLNKQFFDIARFVWNLKKRCYSDKIRIVTPSNWLGEEAKRSKIFSKNQVTVIPNGISSSKYKAIDKISARNVLGIDCNKKVILFGAANSTVDYNKGFDLLQESLEKLSLRIKKRDEFELLVFGNEKGLCDMPFNTRYMGRINDEIMLSVLYAAADVTVVPSRSENFPNVILESMSGGTPCVAFNIGGISDMIQHRINGYLAQPFFTDDLVEGIKYVLDTSYHQYNMREAAKKIVEEQFSLEKIAGEYKNYYISILKNGDSNGE